MQLSTLLETCVAENGWPGATAAIVWNDQRELSIAAGAADCEAPRAMAVRDRMLAGSVGKTFASAAALTLVEDGRLRLDEPILRFRDRLPWIAALPNADRLTLRNILSHRTGLANYIYVDDWRQRWMERVAREPDYSPTIEDSIRVAIDAGPVCASDTETRYADTNYLIAGRLIEAASGEDFYRYLQKRVLDPLALVFMCPSTARRIPGVVPGYLRDAIVPILGRKSIGPDGALIYDPSWEYCGGGLVSTSADLARFLKALFEGKIVSPALLKEMMTSFPMEYPLPNHRYGLGVQRFDSELGPASGHTGQFTGYRSVAFYFETSRIAVAMQVNADAEKLMPAFMKLAGRAHACKDSMHF